MILMKELTRGLFPGRFQPFTIQHEKRIEQILSDYLDLQLVIVVGDVGSLNRQNFLTTAERLEMIAALATVKGWDRVDVVSVKGAPPAKWAENVIKAAGQSEFVFSNNPFILNPLKHAGCIPIALDEGGLSGTFVRELDSFMMWEKLLPETIFKYIKKNNLYKRCRDLKKGDKYPFLNSGHVKTGLIGGADIHKYSVAKEMWSNCFEEMGLPFSFKYLPITNQSELKHAVKMLRDRKWSGVNVALPWKKEVAQYVDRIDRRASKTGLVNCIKNSNGKLIGTNTDGIGFVDSLKINKFDIVDTLALIIGAGGAGLSIGLELAAFGASHIHFIDIVNDYMRSAAQIVQKNYPNVSVGCGKKTNALFDLAVNCSGVGGSLISDMQRTPISMNEYKWSDTCLFAEAIYNPIDTKFLTDATACGYQTLSGNYMLGMQAYHSYMFYSNDKHSNAYKDIFLHSAATASSALKTN